MSSSDGPGPELSRNLVYLLKHAHLRMAELATNAVAPYGIDGRELGVLLCLAGREPASQQQAAQRLSIDRTTMVAMLDALEGKGLVSRHPHAEDRRRNVVELTDAGRETLRQATDANDKAEREFLAPLTPKAAEHLRNSLQKLALPSHD
ncbi:MarR family winged helix-turn-helix transcriptional regulator [Actinomadura madurae]|uniref:MarR family winged helix-turn-helix transcriptional regulator n=1 Tax=Actinomadura madurae TaxID=1993 RepID=UPI000D8847D1|nr:MarR family transcriptional regulator [Actinomadura madurae]SPT51864.1 Salmolysin [Actinomadura madurae]